MLRILDNELTFDSGVWDLTYEGRILTIREGPGQIILQIEFSPPDLIRVPRAEISYRGIDVSVQSDRIVTPLDQCSYSVTAQNLAVMLALGEPEPENSFIWRPDARRRYWPG